MKKITREEVVPAQVIPSWVRPVTEYVADDGEVFGTEERCLAHETKYNALAKLAAMGMREDIETLDEYHVTAALYIRSKEDFEQVKQLLIKGMDFWKGTVSGWVFDGEDWYLFRKYDDNDAYQYDCTKLDAEKSVMHHFLAQFDELNLPEIKAAQELVKEKQEAVIEALGDTDTVDVILNVLKSRLVERGW